MKFEEALKLLKEGKRIISKKDKDAFENQWLNLDEEGFITYMGSRWEPTPEWLLDYMNDEWLDVETCCDYHDHNDKTGECVKY